MAEETKQRSNFKDQMRELSTVNYSEYNKKAKALKEKWFDWEVERVCEQIKDDIKRKVERGQIKRENGKSFVLGTTRISNDYGVWHECDAGDREGYKELIEEYHKIPEEDRSKIEAFIGVSVINCRMYIKFKCVKRKRRLFEKQLYDHTYECYYGKRMVEFLNKIRQKLSSDGIELVAISQEMWGLTRYGDRHNLKFTDFSEHKLIECQKDFIEADSEHYYTFTTSDDYDANVFYPELHYKMEL